jgi:hypothetical protein
MALSSLENLLVQKRINPDEILKCKIFVERLNEEIEISFKRLSYTKYKFFKRAAIERRRNVESFDIDKYRVSIILDCLVDPDFQKKAFLDSFGAPNGEVGINKIFLPGEIVTLGEIILKESGFSEDPFRDGLSNDEEPACDEN